MSSGQPYGNGPALYTLCLCGSFFQSAQAQMSIYCASCLGRIAPHRHEHLAASPVPQAPNYNLGSTPEGHTAWEQPRPGSAPGISSVSRNPASPQPQWPKHSFPTSVIASSLSLSPEIHPWVSAPRHQPSSLQSTSPTGRNATAQIGTSELIALPRLLAPSRVDQSLSREDSALASQKQSPPIRPVASPATIEANQGRRIHDAPFECAIPGCGATFTREYNLNHHLNSHYGVKPYSCRWPGCSKAFGRPYDRARHEKGCAFFQGVDMSQANNSSAAR